RVSTSPPHRPAGGIVAEIDRRTFLQATTAAAALPLAGCVARPLAGHSPTASAIPETAPSLVGNHITSHPHATEVKEIVKPRSADEVRAAVQRGRASGLAVAVA